jgi:ABC transporter substrate binding protein
MNSLGQSLASGAFALLALCLGSPLQAADAPQRVFRIGYLNINPPLAGVASAQIPAEMAKLGYVEGRNIVYEIRHAGGDPARLPALAAELVKLKVDVIVAVAVTAAMAAKAATSEIPIVAYAIHGAVQAGLVPNLRHPGGNITGTETLAPEVDPKRMQLLKQMLPALDSLAVVYDATDHGASEGNSRRAEVARPDHLEPARVQGVGVRAGAGRRGRQAPGRGTHPDQQPDPQWLAAHSRLCDGAAPAHAVRVPLHGPVRLPADLRPDLRRDHAAQRGADRQDPAWRGAR